MGNTVQSNKQSLKKLANCSTKRKTTTKNLNVLTNGKQRLNDYNSDYSSSDSDHTATNDSSENSAATSPQIDAIYHERPIDCQIEDDEDDDIELNRSYNVPTSTTTTTSHHYIRNEEDKFQIDYLFTNDYDSILGCCVGDGNTESKTQHIYNVNTRKHITPIEKRHIYATRRTSLSTIIEEKSQLSSANLSSLCNGGDLVKSQNDLHMINTLLDEYQDKTLVINEIMHVFEPSSKYGNFRRNIPIRLSSKLKYEKLLQSSLSLCNTTIQSPMHTFLSTTTNSFNNSKFSPISYTRATSIDQQGHVTSTNDLQFYNYLQKEPGQHQIHQVSCLNETKQSTMNTTTNSNRQSRNIQNLIIDGRKARFLRRLKKHIENIRGTKLNMKTTTTTTTTMTNMMLITPTTNITNRHQVKSLPCGLPQYYAENELELNFYEDIDHLSNAAAQLQQMFYENNLLTNSHSNHKIFSSSQLLVKTDVNPVYF